MEKFILGQYCEGEYHDAFEIKHWDSLMCLRVDYGLNSQNLESRRNYAYY